MKDELFEEYENTYDIPLCDAVFDHPEHLALSVGTILKRKGEMPAIAPDLLDDELIRFYSVIERWEFKWRTEEASPVQMQGTFNIIPVEKVKLILKNLIFQ